MTVSQKKKA